MSPKPTIMVDGREVPLWGDVRVDIDWWNRRVSIAIPPVDEEPDRGWTTLVFEDAFEIHLWKDFGTPWSVMVGIYEADARNLFEPGGLWLRRREGRFKGRAIRSTKQPMQVSIDGDDFMLDFIYSGAAHWVDGEPEWFTPSEDQEEDDFAGLS